MLLRALRSLSCSRCAAILRSSGLRHLFYSRAPVGPASLFGHLIGSMFLSLGASAAATFGSSSPSPLKGGRSVKSDLSLGVLRALCVLFLFFFFLFLSAAWWVYGGGGNVSAMMGCGLSGVGNLEFLTLRMQLFNCSSVALALQAAGFVARTRVSRQNSPCWNQGLGGYTLRV